MQHRVALVLALLGSTALAQSVVDPTRPPQPPVAASPQRAEPAAHAASAAAAPRLQAIQTQRDGKSSALVDGHVVRAGEHLGEQTVVAIDALGITLRGTRGNTQVLLLLSGMTKTPSRSTPDAAARLAAGNSKELR